jgi:hypothetical protein
MMSVERTHNTEAGKHCRASEIDHQHQRLDGGLPFRRIMLALRQLGDEGGGVVQRDQPAAIWQQDRIVRKSAASLDRPLGCYGFCLSVTSRAAKLSSSSLSRSIIISTISSHSDRVSECTPRNVSWLWRIVAIMALTLMGPRRKIRSSSNSI